MHDAYQTFLNAARTDASGKLRRDTAYEQYAAVNIASWPTVPPSTTVIRLFSFSKRVFIDNNMFNNAQSSACLLLQSYIQQYRFLGKSIRHSKDTVIYRSLDGSPGRTDADVVLSLVQLQQLSHLIFR